MPNGLKPTEWMDFWIKFSYENEAFTIAVGEGKGDDTSNELISHSFDCWNPITHIAFAAKENTVKYRFKETSKLFSCFLLY